MEYKIIRLENGKYFTSFGGDGFMRYTTRALEARMFTPREIWHEETELNAVEDELDKRGVEYKIMILSYEVREF